MKVTNFSTNRDGGAAIAAFRLHEGLRKLGHESLFLNRDIEVPKDSVFRLPYFAVARARSILSKLRKRIPKAPAYSWDSYHHLKFSKSCELFSDFRSDAYRGKGHRYPQTEIAHLHWVSFFLDLPSFFSEYATTTPIVWTLHDMNPLTGGCHYDNNCGKYLTTCVNCPQLATSGPSDTSNAIFIEKRAFFNSIPANALTLVSPSRWLDDQITKSPIFSRFEHYVIPYGVDTDTFLPKPTATVNNLSTTPTLLFIASDLSNPRKGFSVLQSALTELDKAGISFTLRTVGNTINGHQDYKNITIVNSGFVKSVDELATIYSQCDALILPSLQDNLPNTILESLACGTPIIANPVGGIPDAVKPSKTGWLTADTTSKALAETLRLAIGEISRGRSLRETCREVAVEQYSLAVQASKYIELYSNLLSRRIKRP